MRVTIPYNAANGIYLEVEVMYDIIATGGPPEPPFGIEVQGFSFVCARRVDDDSILELFELADFDSYDLGEDCEPFEGYIEEYLTAHGEEIRAACRDFELTRDESMV